MNESPADIDVVISASGAGVVVIGGRGHEEDHVYLRVESEGNAKLGDHTIASAVQAAALILQQALSDQCAEKNARTHATGFVEAAMEAMNRDMSAKAGHRVNDRLPVGAVEVCDKCGYGKPVGVPCPTCRLLEETGEKSVVAAAQKAGAPKPPIEATHSLCPCCGYVRPVLADKGARWQCPKCDTGLKPPYFAYDIRTQTFVEVGGG